MLNEGAHPLGQNLPMMAAFLLGWLKANELLGPFDEGRPRDLNALFFESGHAMCNNYVWGLANPDQPQSFPLSVKPS